MGGEDFSFMLEARPGAFIFIGNGDTAGLHHPAYDFNDNAIPVGIVVLGAAGRDRDAGVRRDHARRARHEQERRALALGRKVRLRGDLLGRRSPFVDVRHGEAGAPQQGKIRRDGAVLLDHALGEPVGRARALVEVAVDRPGLAAIAHRSQPGSAGAV